MTTRRSTPAPNWSRAYARQALSDLQARDVLANSLADRCHRLHFLQMAAEKTCKAHLSFENGDRDVKRSPAYVRQVLPIVARNFTPNSTVGKRFLCGN